MTHTHKYTVPEVSSLSSQGSACALSAVIVFVCSVEPSEAVWGECVCGLGGEGVWLGDECVCEGVWLGMKVYKWDVCCNT